MSKQEEMQKIYELYCEKMAKNRGISVEEAKELKTVQNYKEYLEVEFDDKVVE